MALRTHLVCWRRVDHPGHEVARLEPRDTGWRLSGTAVLVYAGIPCALTYAVDLDAMWRTRAATVEGWLGERAAAVELVADGVGRWWRDGVECPAVAGCVDVDYGFSPATNLLPVRRLALAVGAVASVRAAWLRFPELTLEPLDQRYRRMGERAYVYESAGGAFRADLDVDAEGMVVRYGGLWTAEAGARPAPSPGAA
jgi:uncharacterized protein